MTEFKETDLYEPIRAFLEEEGYQVQAEVKHCDIAAEKDGNGCSPCFVWPVTA